MAGQRRVAIIGAGLSGLVATKSCLEEGLEPVCYEQNDSIGGIWFYTEEVRHGQGARAYRGLSTNISKEMIAFSDFPFPPDVSTFVPCSKVHEYAVNYSETFGLNKHIHLNTNVRMVRKAPDYEYTGKWEVETDDACQVFDFVMVCSGYHKKARFPAIKGMDTFTGSIDHAITFEDGINYRNQRVLVVGNSHSAGDVSCPVAYFADQVFLCIGNGTWIIPKYGKRGVPIDYLVWSRSNSGNKSKLDQLIMGLCNDRCDHTLHSICPSVPPSESSVMINDEIQNKIMNGMVKIVGELVRLGPREAEFEDGTVVQNLDAIIFATGYDLRLDFMNMETLGGKEKLSLYKMEFPTQLPFNTLSLIGCLAAEGPFPPLVELQARLAARVFAGNHQLPSKVIMREETDKMNKSVYKRFGRFKYSVPNIPFRDNIATELGVAPSWWDLIKAGPRFAYYYYYGPAFPYYHRVWGPHSWSGAKEAIDQALEHGYYSQQLRKFPGPLNSAQARFLFPFVLISVAVLTKMISLDIIFRQKY